MEANFQTLRARTAQGRMVRKKQWDRSSDRLIARKREESGNQAKPVSDQAIGTAILFLAVEFTPDDNAPGAGSSSQTPGSLDLLASVGAPGRNLPQCRQGSCCGGERGLGIGFEHVVLPQPEDRPLRSGSRATVQAS
jgi:hypothetical protein